jgi:hypothetical protein
VSMTSSGCRCMSALQRRFSDVERGRCPIRAVS